MTDDLFSMDTLDGGMIKKHSSSAGKPKAKSEPFVLTNDNYFSDEASKRYMSNSRYGSWISCAARQKAIENGEFTPDDDKPHFSGGRYAHMMILEPERQEEFDKDYPNIRKEVQPEEQYSVPEWTEICNTVGVEIKPRASRKAIVKALIEAGHADLIPEVKHSYRSDFIWIESAMECYEKQDVISSVIDRGQHETVLTFELGGMLWKAMIDNLRVEDQQFGDLKFMKDFKDVWNKERRQYITWFENRDYMRQMAVYQRAILCNHEGGNFTPNIYGFSKERPFADVVWKQFTDQQDLNRRIQAIEESMPRVMGYISGDIEPPRCNKHDCDFCRSTKVVTRPDRPTFTVAG